MSKRQITVEHDGRTFYGEVMTVKSTSLGVEDHGILTAYLHCEAPGSGIGVGGYGLDTPIRDAEGKFLGREPTAYGLDHVMQLMRTVGVDRWEKVPGQQVIVLFEREGSWGQTAAGIAHVTDVDRVLILKDHADQWLARDTERVPA